MENYPNLLQCIGNTPIVELKVIDFKENLKRNNHLLLKLEGFNPTGSLKDRPAYWMILNAEKQGQIKPGNRLLEATSGNMGIALSMIAAQKKYPLTLIMPDSQSTLRQEAMRTFGADIVLTPQSGGMELSRDVADQMARDGKGFYLNQFDNPANLNAHFWGTAPEIWRQTQGKITHCLACLGSSGTLMGTAKFLKEKNPNIQIIAITPDSNGHIPGIRKWEKNYIPGIFNAHLIDQSIEIPLSLAEENRRLLAKEEGIFVGTSSGAALAAMRHIAQHQNNATILMIAADRGEKYLNAV